MGIVESDLYMFCNLTKEDIEHLFFSCSFSLIFWKDFELCWKIVFFLSKSFHLQFFTFLVVGLSHLACV